MPCWNIWIGRECAGRLPEREPSGVEGGDRMLYAFSASTTALPEMRPLPAFGERSLPLSATVEPAQ